MAKQIDKRTIIIGLSVLLIAIGAVGLYKFNKDYYPLWNSNNISVSVEDPLMKDKVKIELSNYSSVDNVFNTLYYIINEDTGYSELYKPTLFVVFDGDKEENIGNAYGENDFTVTYDNKYSFSFRQFKSNWKPQHNYDFNLYQKGDSIYVQVSIEGRYARSLKGKMSKL